MEVDSDRNWYKNQDFLPVLERYNQRDENFFTVAIAKIKLHTYDRTPLLRVVRSLNLFMYSR